MRIAAMALALTLAWGSSAKADEVFLFTLEPAAHFPISSPQSELYGPGLALGGGLYRSLGSRFMLGARARGGIFFDGPPPALASFRDPGLGTLTTFGLALRLRLFKAGDEASRGTGLFVEAVGGGAATGSLFRAALEGAAGYAIGIGALNLGVVVRYIHVFQPDDLLGNEDARVLSVGLELGFGDGRDPEPVEESVEANTTDPERMDQDYDGYRDAVDECPNQAEDHDGFEDGDGCPDPDNDADGVLDENDECVVDAEDPDAFQDEDGCPDPDNDFDGFEDANDGCPNEAEIVNGVEDEDGCPDVGLFEVRDDKIVLETPLLFDPRGRRVHPEGREILQAVAGYLRDNPTITLVRVDAHVAADEEGPEGLRVSQAQADAVRNTILRYGGFDASRIEAHGVGATQPIDQGEDESAYVQNRRIEIVILTRGEAAAEESGADLVFESDAAASSDEGADMVFDDDAGAGETP